MKKFLCFICIFCIIITTIPVHANAEIVIDDLIEMYIQWFIDTGSKMLNMTPDELISYCNTPQGYQWLQTVWNASGGMMGNVFFNPAGDAKRAVKDANNSRYISYKIKKNLLQNLANNYNGYCNEVNRNLNYANYIVQAGYNLRTDFGYVDGSPPYVGDGTGDMGIHSISVWFHPTAFYDDTVQVYKGSYLSPPVIYVPSNGALKFCGVSLRAGYYIPCSDTQLFYLGNNDITYKTGWYYVDFGSDNRLLYQRSYSNAPRFLDTGISDTMQDYNSGIYTFDYLYDKLVKSVGLYLPMNNQPWIELPPNSDFDSDDTITMLLPIDEPAPPIYIPNDVYENDITNNVYTYDNDTTNNCVTNNDIQNIYNILYSIDTDTSTGGGSYDDTTLLQTLRNYFNQIVGYLKDIKDLLTERKQAEENMGTDDTPFTIPALTKMSNLFSTLQSAITDDNLTPPVLKIRIMTYEATLDFSWFSPDSTIYWVIRRLLETSIYIQGILYILSLIKSFVGLNSSQ